MLDKHWHKGLIFSPVCIPWIVIVYYQFEKPHVKRVGAVEGLLQRHSSAHGHIQQCTPPLWQQWMDFLVWISCYRAGVMCQQHVCPPPHRDENNTVLTKFVIFISFDSDFLDATQHIDKVLSTSMRSLSSRLKMRQGVLFLHQGFPIYAAYRKAASFPLEQSTCLPKTVGMCAC